ncbi:penicillin-binding transpeptidase domain-containing protein [Nonomuraea glycinis]|uniref:penicillin-binding transpeptidase domain-containing protein n=1 Tax=Nonomuraea glycinis TaxID=2047744 RepID=UPI002E11CA9F|nr:penicillin-binding transpeptidase domain-containing protein [Nonomuraea glycinis]
MLFALLAHLTLVQAFESRDLNADPRNERTRIARFGQPRGDIVTYDGTAVAVSRETGGGPYRYQRFYPHGEMYAPITGHVSPRGAGGIERAREAVLSGDDARVKVQSLVREGTAQGADVWLTIRKRVQWAAYRSLKASGRPGAAVAVNPATGAILALATYPSYDPNAYTTFDAAALAATDDRLRRDPAEPLLNRALDRTYPPGAVSKLITAATALTTGGHIPSTALNPSGNAHDRDGRDDRGGPEGPEGPEGSEGQDGRGCGEGRLTLSRAFRLSCDQALADLGRSLGQDALRDQAEAFGFNTALTVPLPVAVSTYPAAQDRPGTALAAVGDSGIRVTPLMVAMLSATVANDGTLMRPYLVERARLPGGSTINRAGPSPYRTAMSPAMAGQLTTMMTTRPRPQGPGTEVALASTGSSTVFTAFAPARAPEVAVGVVLDHPGPTAAIAHAILQAALS